jgi:hypothetical protein
MISNMQQIKLKTSFLFSLPTKIQFGLSLIFSFFLQWSASSIAQAQPCQPTSLTGPTDPWVSGASTKFAFPL